MPDFNPAIVVRCSTTEHMAKLEAEDPSLKPRRDLYEQQMQSEIRRSGGRGDGGGLQAGGFNVEIIP